MPESRERTEEGRGDTVEANTPSLAELDERVRLALHAAGEKKAHDLVVLDLREVASFTDYFIITSGTNVRQVQAISDAVQEQLRKQLSVKPARVEGYNSAEWVLLDYGDFIFHVFEDKSRRFYDLERLWRDAARVPLPPDVAAGGDTRGGSLRNER
ncbi:MAG: ribosome-associated protein [Acidobacteriota bacterium]|jgi:ribosome-associated protein|nr:ribosome-associated protein [Acidobacteriota bacterium]